MAYILYDSLGDAMRGGPYSHKAGEFCGNVLRNRNIAVLGDGTAVIMSPVVLLSLPNLYFVHKEVKVKIGEPAGNGRFSSQEIKTSGYFGLYLTEDLPLPEDAIEFETDMFLEEVVSGERSPEKPFDISKIRRREL